MEGGTINGTQDSFVRVKAGEKVTIKADAPAENMQFHHWKVEEGTSVDFGVTVGTLGSDMEQGTEEIAFIMPPLLQVYCRLGRYLRLWQKL